MRRLENDYIILPLAQVFISVLSLMFSYLLQRVHQLFIFMVIVLPQECLKSLIEANANETLEEHRTLKSSFRGFEMN